MYTHIHRHSHLFELTSFSSRDYRPFLHHLLHALPTSFFLLVCPLLFLFGSLSLHILFLCVSHQVSHSLSGWIIHDHEVKKLYLDWGSVYNPTWSAHPSPQGPLRPKCFHTAVTKNVTLSLSRKSRISDCSWLRHLRRNEAASVPVTCNVINLSSYSKALGYWTAKSVEALSTTTYLL